MSNNNNRRRGGGGGGRGPRPSSQQQQNYNDLPLEQGVICSLKDSFGFIHCADRLAEVFFHYTSVEGMHPDDLHMDMEVEFRIGSSPRDPTKLAAYQVRPLPEGVRIEWETDFQEGKRLKGMVERAARTERGGNRGGGGVAEGTIKLLMEASTTNSNADVNGGQHQELELVASDELVRFQPSSFADSKGPRRLVKGDLIECRVVIDRRTKDMYARDITLIQSEKERLRIESEQKQLASASAEVGMIITLKHDFGFIRSTKRREHVYFHYSHLIVPETEEDFVLKEGQEVKFLVLEETEDRGKKSSARQVECIEKGSVVFQKLIERAVTGTIVTLPPIGNNSTGEPQISGTVALSNPIQYKEEGQESPVEVTEVSLWYEDLPTHFLKQPERMSSAGPSLWLREGDTIRFDVVKDSVDDSFQVASATSTSTSIQLIELNPVGRAEGSVVTLKADYGFISFADRKVDVHFKFSDILPDEVQTTVVKHLRAKKLSLNIDVGVQFDMSAQDSPEPSGGSGRGGRQGKAADEKLRAYRCLLIPRAHIVSEFPISETEVRGTVKSTDPQKSYLGSIELEEPISIPAVDGRRHPLVARTIKSFLDDTGRQQAVFPYVLGPKEEEVVIELVKSIGNGAIKVSHVPVPSKPSHPGRICLSKVSQDDATRQDDKEETKTPAPLSFKTIKNIQFDVTSKKAYREPPPAPGDVISCKLKLIRKQGIVFAREMTVVERIGMELLEEDRESKEGVGVVREIAKAGQFGFINVLDEDASKVEVLLFHTKDAVMPVKKGDEVKFEIKRTKKGKAVAQNVTPLPKGTIPSKASKSACLGYILLEPSHTSLSDTPLRKTHSSVSNSSDKSSSRWKNVREGDIPADHNKDVIEDGIILLLEDKTAMFSVKSGDGKAESSAEDKEKVETTQDKAGSVAIHIPYKSGGVAIHGAGAVSSIDGSSALRRGDLVSFMKSKSGKTARDIRLVKRQEATTIRGRLENLDRNALSQRNGTLTFIAANEAEDSFTVAISEVVSCDPSALKERESVEAILLDGKLFGICRTVDLYLESKLGGNHKERPKLNLAVKKDRGGRIIAQSMQAKGPDGTTGFAPGWTQRVSEHAVGLSGAAKEFVPSFQEGNVTQEDTKSVD